MKNLLLLLLVLLPLGLRAQKFELTAKGFVDADNPEKNYIVIPFEGKNQKEIFDMAFSAVGKSFISPKDKITPIENTQININGFFENATFLNRGIAHIFFNMYYNLVLEFKDGKMKINSPVVVDIIRSPIQLAKFTHDDDWRMCLTIADKKKLKDIILFNKKGVILYPKQKEKIEDTTNKPISNLIRFMKEVDSENW